MASECFIRCFCCNRSRPSSCFSANQAGMRDVQNSWCKLCVSIYLSTRSLSPHLKKKSFARMCYSWKPLLSQVTYKEKKICGHLMERYADRYLYGKTQTYAPAFSFVEKIQMVKEYVAAPNADGIPCLVLHCIDETGIFTIEERTQQTDEFTLTPNVYVESRCGFNDRAYRGQGLVFQATRVGDTLVFEDVLMHSHQRIPLTIQGRVAFIRAYLRETCLPGATVCTIRGLDLEPSHPSIRIKDTTPSDTTRLPTDGWRLIPSYPSMREFYWSPQPLCSFMVASWLFKRDVHTNTLLYPVFAMFAFSPEYSPTVVVTLHKKVFEHFHQRYAPVGWAEVPFDDCQNPGSLCIADFRYGHKQKEELLVDTERYFPCTVEPVRWCFVRFRPDKHGPIVQHEMNERLVSFGLCLSRFRDQTRAPVPDKHFVRERAYALFSAHGDTVVDVDWRRRSNPIVCSEPLDLWDRCAFSVVVSIAPPSAPPHKSTREPSHTRVYRLRKDLTQPGPSETETAGAGSVPSADVIFLHDAMKPMIECANRFENVWCNLKPYMNPTQNWRLVLTYRESITEHCIETVLHDLKDSMLSFHFLLETRQHYDNVGGWLVFTHDPLSFALEQSRIGGRCIRKPIQSDRVLRPEFYRNVFQYLSLPDIGSFFSTFRWARSLVRKHVRLSDGVTQRQCGICKVVVYHGSSASKFCKDCEAGVLFRSNWRSAVWKPCIGNYRLPRLHPNLLPLLFHLFGHRSMHDRTWYFEGLRMAQRCVTASEMYSALCRVMNKYPTGSPSMTDMRAMYLAPQLFPWHTDSPDFDDMECVD